MILFWGLTVVLLVLALSFLYLPLCKRPIKPREYIILLGLSVLIGAFSLGFYLKQGSSVQLSQSMALQRRALHLQALLDAIGNDPQKAIIMMQQYLKNKPKDKHAWYLLSKLYEGVGELRSAEDAAKKAKEVTKTAPPPTTSGGDAALMIYSSTRTSSA